MHRYIRAHYNVHPRNFYGLNRIEKPLVLTHLASALEVTLELAEFFACFDAEIDTAIPQHFAAFALVDLGVDVQ